MSTLTLECRREYLQRLIKEAFPTMAVEHCCCIVAVFCDSDKGLIDMPELQAWIMANCEAINRWERPTRR